MADIGFKLNGDNSGFRAMIDSSHNALTKFNSAMGLVGVGISVGAATAFFKNVVGRAGDLQDLSDRLGVSTDHLQAFDLAVRLAGGSSEQANKVWDITRKSLDELAAGTDKAKAEFGALGLSAKDFAGLGIAEALELTAKGYVENADKAGAYEAMISITGKSGAALNAVFQQIGTEGLAVLMKALDESGTKIEKDTIRQLDELGDRATVAFGKIQAAGAVLVGWFVKLGESIGTAMATAMNKRDRIDTVLESSAVSAKKAADAVKVLTPIMKDLDAAAKDSIKTDLEKDRLSKEHLAREMRLALLYIQEHDLEKAMTQEGRTKGVMQAQALTLAEIQKQIKLEEKGLAADEKKHANSMEEITKKEIEDKRALMTLNQQKAALRQDEKGWIAVMNDFSATQEVRDRAEVELGKTRAQMRDVELGKKKEGIELAKLLLIPTEKLTAEEKIRLDLLTGVVTQKQLDEEFSRLAAGAVAGTLLPAEKERLAALVGSSEEYAKQLASAAGITVAAKEFVLTLGRKGDSYEQQSTDALMGVRDRIKAQLDAARRQNAAAPRSAYNPIEVSLASEYQQIMNELSARENVGGYANKFGETKARGKYGDELVDRALRDLTDTNVRTTTAIEDIQQRLATLFPKK